MWGILQEERVYRVPVRDTEILWPYQMGTTILDFNGQDAGEALASAWPYTKQLHIFPDQQQTTQNF